LLVCAGLLAGCGSLSSYMPAVDPVPGTNVQQETVTRVVDGDTIVVREGTLTVRILGIDSPETRKPNTPVQCGGPESTAWAKLQLPIGSQVALQTEAGREDTDRYGRRLAYVKYVKDNQTLDFSVESARAGMSRNYVYDKRPVSLQSDIEAAETEARNAHRGLWNHC